jgi:hypothetical protein
VTETARRRRYAIVTTVLGALLSLYSALAMRDHVRLVEIIELFFGGFGTGAGIAALVARHTRDVTQSSR